MILTKQGWQRAVLYGLISKKENKKGLSKVWSTNEKPSMIKNNF